MNILVTGGAGYVGSHAVRQLLKAGHDVTVLDDLSSGHAEAVECASLGVGRARLFQGNVADRELVRETVLAHSIEAVMHFAAFSEVADSIADPAKYYRNNFINTHVMLETLRETGVRKLVLSSTAAVYGNPDAVPVTEDALLEPISPYGRSKLMIEYALADHARAYGLGYTTLRYFNVAGASADGVLGEAHEPESHLIPRILSAACGSAEDVHIYGDDYPTHDGTCIRDYVHVDDLAAAHVLAIEALEPGQSHVYNLGSEHGFSVREVISACARVIGRDIPTRVHDRRPGDPAILIASSARIRAQLGWERRYPGLETIVQHAWRWHESHPNGYELRSARRTAA